MFRLLPLHKTTPKPKASVQLTEEEIRKRAYKIWKRRVAQGKSGTSEQDWQRAIEELQLTWWDRLWAWTGIAEKKGWDLLTSLSLPLVLFLGGSLFTYWNNLQQQQIADNKAKQEAFNKYLDQMNESLKDGLLKAYPNSEKFAIAQSRTIITLLSLDKTRQNLLIQFLNASGLNQVGDTVTIDKDGNVNPGKGSRVLLYKAQMEKVNLANSDLSGASLIGANLGEANIGCNPPESQDRNQCSSLARSSLFSANLSFANLSYADLTYGGLFKADLSFADLHNAFLSYADLKFADLTHANLSGAYLAAADLTLAQGWTDEQLSKAYLCNTTLPEGSKLDPNRDCKAIGMPLMKTKSPKHIQP